MNIFEALRKDHEKQRSLLRKLVNTHGESDDRTTIFENLKLELQKHADAEERYFYVPLIESGKTQERARHSIAEHNEIDELIEKLESTDQSSPGWLATAKKLEKHVMHHLDEEEHEIFQMAGKVLKERQKSELANEYQNAMK